MPTASTFAVNDGAATPTATTFTLFQPAGGNLPATYVAKTKGPSVSAQPKLAVSSTGTSKTRESRLTVRTPYWVTGTDGVTKVIDSAFTEIRTVLPDSVPDAVRADHAAYLANFLAVPQIRDTIRDGFAPN